MQCDLLFKLFANCIPVKGASRSTICDLQTGKVHLIPNALFDLLQNGGKQSISQAKATVEDIYHETLDEYFDFLESEGLIFFTENPEQFPPLSQEWHSPSRILHAIMDFDAASTYDYRHFLNELNQADCKYIELRFFDDGPLERYKKILTAVAQTTIISINLIVKHNEDISFEAWKSLCKMNSRITGITIHSCMEEQDKRDVFWVPISYIKSRLTSEKCCGVIAPHTFVSNTETFMEGLSFNSCLNRKISVDSHGQIRNCPSMRTSYGEAGHTGIEELLENTELIRLWNIPKSKISTCRDCEFRHICTDCRAYLEDPNDDYSKPLKCGYNPYTCEWEDWSTHPMKQQAIDHYGLRGLTNF